MTELKPCPFCGSRDIKETALQTLFPQAGFVRSNGYVCLSCGSKNYKSMWNNRPAEAKIKADAFAAGFKEGLMLPIPSLPDNSEPVDSSIDRLAYHINKIPECAGREYVNKLEQGE